MYKKGNNKTYVQQGKLVGYKFELFPDYFQRKLLQKHEGHARFIYNWALEQWLHLNSNKGEFKATVNKYKHLNGIIILSFKKEEFKDDDTFIFEIPLDYK